MLTTKLTRVVLLVAILSGGTACTAEPHHQDAQPESAQGNSPPIAHSIDLSLAPVETPPYEGPVVTPIDHSYLDVNGVVVYEREGTRYHHPVAAIQYALEMLNSYRLTDEPRFLEVAVSNAEAVLANSAKDERGLWLPYPFDFPLHGDTNNTIRAPWHSAMAQGQALSLFCRLHEATDDSNWIAAANDVFQTLTNVYTEESIPLDEPWVTFVDSSGWLWLEEYAGSVAPMKVLNGHVFAMFGLYDYAMLCGHQEAQFLFEAAAATVIRYVPELRNPGAPSWYGMRIQDNPRAASERYHMIHVEQLAQLAQLTDHPVFAEYAALLHQDFGLDD